MESDRDLLTGLRNGAARMERRFADKIALVTGATTEIGEATAGRFATESQTRCTTKIP